MVVPARMLIWAIDEIAGFDVAWVSIEGERLMAEGQQSGLMPMPYWVRYRLETTERFVTKRMTTAKRSSTFGATKVGGRSTANHARILRGRSISIWPAAR